MESNLPVRTSFLTFGSNFKSTMEVMTPSRVPNSESIPNVNSIKKNKIDHRGAHGNWLMASVKTMKANPVPEADWKTRQIYPFAHESNLEWLHFEVFRRDHRLRVLA